MGHLYTSKIRFFRILFLTLLSVNVWAADFAEIAGDGNEVFWTIGTAGSYKSVVLRVSTPDGSITTEEFDSPSAPFYAFGADGMYQYELWTTPKRGSCAISLATVAELAANGRESRSAARGFTTRAAASNSQVQSGSFFIQNGAFVSPEVEEETEDPGNGNKK